MATVLGGKGVAVLFFTVVIALFAYFIYFLAMGNTDPAYYWQPPSRTSKAPLAPDSPRARNLLPDAGSRLILIREEAQTVGRLNITYMGIEAKHLIFDVKLLDLDPNFAYHYKVPIAKARERFRLAELYFQAHATSQSKIRLTRFELK